MTEPDRLSPPEQEEVVQEVAGVMLSVAPAGWRKVELIYRSTVAVDAAEILATTTGESQRIPVPMKVSSRMSSLREGMYEQDRGSWFTARLVLEPGKYQIEYDYDGEPTYVPPLTAGTYALDFQHYPRSDEHTPDWLREKLAEAEPPAEPDEAGS
jgi:hypothetical protein